MSMPGATAAVALLSWFLLQPPAPGGVAAVNAPLGTWIVNGTFGTPEACESTRSQNLAALAYGETKGGTNARELAARGVITHARCISTDELRAALATPTPTPGL